MKGEAMTTAFIIGLISMLVIFVAYNIYILYRFGIPESLSETSYLLGKNKWMFSIVCVLFTLVVLPPWIGASIVNTEFLTLFACGGIAFAGLTPMYRESFQKTIHYTSAIISSICMVIWMAFNDPSLILMLGVLFIVPTAFKPKSYVYWFELESFIVIISYLIQHYHAIR